MNTNGINCVPISVIFADPEFALLGKHNDVGLIADLDDTENHDDRLSFIYVVHDKGANNDSSPIFTPSRAFAIRSFRSYIKTLPEHVDPKEFRIDRVGFCFKGSFVTTQRETIASGAEYSEG